MKTIIFSVLLFLIPMVGFSEEMENCITEEKLQEKAESDVKKALKNLGQTNASDEQEKKMLEIAKKRLKIYYTLRGIDIKSECGIYI